jgi:hypothetical protein
MPDRTHELHGVRQGLEEHSTAYIPLPEASNAFFTSSNGNFTEEKNTLKARYGTLWNKKIAYRHRTAYMGGQGIARDKPPVQRR